MPVIHQKCQTYFRCPSEAFFVRCHPFHFLECWHYLVMLIVILHGNGASEWRRLNGCCYLFICEPKPNANDYFMWQSPDAWILFESTKWPNDTREKAMTWVFFSLSHTHTHKCMYPSLSMWNILFCTCVCDKSNADWRNGNKIKLKFSSEKFLF